MVLVMVLNVNATLTGTVQPVKFTVIEMVHVPDMEHVVDHLEYIEMYQKTDSVHVIVINLGLEKHVIKNL
jgi:hypothetical protein